MRFDPLAVVEAAYTWDPSVERWLEAIARAMRPLGKGLGIYARIDDWTDRDKPTVLAGVWSEGPADWIASINRIQAAAAPELNRCLYAPGQPIERARRMAARLSPEHAAGWSRAVAPFMHDCLGLFGHDVDGLCLHVGIPLPAPRRIPPRTLGRLRAVAAHLTSAVRLRGARPAPCPEPASAEAVIAPGGRVAHATGDAQAPSMRERLSRSARILEHARGPMRRRDPDEALAVWRGLVEGRWSLVDHWDSDGRRFLLARRNAPSGPDPKVLSQVEGAVVAFVVLGHPEKYVAYLLGLSPSTVASHFASARRKLGVRSRQELITLLSGTARKAGR